MAQLFSLTLSMLLVSCASSYNQATYESYLGPRLYVESTNYQEALKALEPLEKGGLVTTTEKNWLALLDQKNTGPELLQIAKLLENRLTLDITDESVATFVNETKDRYYPSEHEATFIYLVLAMSDLKKGNTGSAKVSLKRAARYLESGYGIDNKRLDTASLRLWAGSLWAAAGDWNAAKIDFKIASKLNPNSKNLKTLSKLKKPPKSLHIVLSGTGPQIIWKPSNQMDHSAITNIKFINSMPPPALQVKDPKSIASISALNSLQWYDDHQSRFHELKTAINSIAYAPAAVGTSIIAAINFGLVATYAATLVATGTAAGIYIAAAAIAGESAEAGFILGSLVAYTGWSGGFKLYRAGKNNTEELLQAGTSELSTYRFVRFIPDYLSLHASHSDKVVIRASKKNRKLKPFWKHDNEHTAVSFYHNSSTSRKKRKARIVPRHLDTPDASWFWYDQPVRFTRDDPCGKNGTRPSETEMSQLIKFLNSDHASHYYKEFIEDLYHKKFFWIKSTIPQHIDLKPHKKTSQPKDIYLLCRKEGWFHSNG